MALSNAVLLEHVNLNLGPRSALDTMRLMLCDGMGMLEDPRPADMVGRSRDTLLWANCGLQQFHLPVDKLEAGAETKLSQQVDGVIELTIPAGSAAAFVEQLARVGAHPLLGTTGATPVVTVSVLGNAFALIEQPADANGGGLVGRTFIGGSASLCRGQPGFTLQDVLTAPPPSAGASPVRPLGIRSIVVRTPSTALACIAGFWEGVMGARVKRTYSPLVGAPPTLIRVRALFDGHYGVASEGDRDCGGNGGEGVGAPAADGSASGSQWLDFEGVMEEDGPPLLPYDGHHFALYLRDWEGAYARAAATGTLYHGTRFADKCRTLEEAKAFHQFRTLPMRPLGGCACGSSSDSAASASAGCASWGLELEVRALSHPACPL